MYLTASLVKISYSSSCSPLPGVTRSAPTNIAFRVLAFTFDAKGQLTMKLRSDLTKVKVKYLEEVDGGIGVHVAGHIKEDEECPHTLGTTEVAAYCNDQDSKP